ncbi:hypothetical protein HBH56_184360 [Parastagonospora nodorum]|uniref:Uncharacterized protein n=1 Tax=Phaeosphaeria nodorum (strain SN15 / ATCC MYA-4574 / FGSC 10173) TaxID=321614 RepID=A0A7U2I6Z1_PHANO|nr:hypothetical protein HBH56_184360 [Parastagonospora nodorum]QRD04069.1 hypothetical protein JI435_128080 [Parastagonospora nodorum SN15]KAH3926090.1 hypothetical protein HBH54_173510 [Parastagonospora nodorum]KAH3962480.1 hypothetical protein HBH52_224990 [Parastagonospora nodorum]KAH4047122.1 hypothetical protein HBH49_177750 [Parastagonospora nodorum]
MACGTTEGTLPLFISKKSPHALRRFHRLHCAEFDGSHLCRVLCGPSDPPQWHLPHRTVGASTIEQALPLAPTNCPRFTLSPHFSWTHGRIVDTHTSRYAFKLQIASTTSTPKLHTRRRLRNVGPHAKTA